MTIDKRRYIFMGLALTALLLVISACSPSVGTTNGTSSLTVLQVLQKSADVMQKLNSVHFETTSNGSIQSNGSVTQTTATPVPTHVSFNLKGSGDELMPDQESSRITINSDTNFAEIVMGNKVYIQNTKGQWYVVDKSSLQGLSGNPFAGTNLPDMNNWLVLIQHVQLTDNGTQSLNGQNLRHITAALDKDALKQLLTSNQQLSSMLGKQNINQVLDATRSLTSTLDVWIDESTFYVHRTELKFNLNADLSSLGNSITPTSTSTLTLPTNVTTTFDSIVDLSNFNAPVTITPPANAIPTDNPVTIFGG